MSSNGIGLYNQLNAEQKEIVDIVLKSCEDVNNADLKCFYVDGPGGTGKTFVYNTIYNLLRRNGKKKLYNGFYRDRSNIVTERNDRS